MTSADKVTIDLSKQLIKTTLPLNQQITILKSSSNKVSFKTGDVFKLTMKKLDEKNSMIQLFNNLSILIRLSIPNDLFVYPELVSHCDNIAIGKWGIYFSKQNDHDYVSI